MATQDIRTAGKRNTVLGVLALLAGMTLLVVYAVPLYELFCRATGFGGTTQRATAAPGVPDALPGGHPGRTVTVRFLAATNPNLPWHFQPRVDSVRVALGEHRLIAYRAQNLADRATTGVATFNVTPAKAGVHFTKIACFCFDRQTLQPGAAMDMPVSFFIDPALAQDRNLRDVDTITLSYTFFRAAPEDGEDERADTGANAVAVAQARRD